MQNVRNTFWDLNDINANQNVLKIAKVALFDLK